MTPPADVDLLAVVGPTAAGKSWLAIALALALGGEVVNADSMQTYRGMDIGTAKVTEAERRGVPHHLLDVWDVTEPADVARWAEQARAAVADVRARGRLPIVCGGSGLYVSALLDGYVFPGTDPAVRARLEADLTEHGPLELHARLAARAPDAAEAVLPSNGRRLVRALEVLELTGDVRAVLPRPRAREGLVVLGLDAAAPPTLDARINSRVASMFELGLVDEVAALEREGLRDGRTASRALGYRQVLDWHDGLWPDEAGCRAETARATRRFARRQRSWFRRDGRVVWLMSAGSGSDVGSDGDAGSDRGARDRLLDQAVAEVARAAHRRPATVGRQIAWQPPDPPSSVRGVHFLKGHGTGNDFVVLPDPDGAVDLTPDLARALCDRRFGIGADGVLRVVQVQAAGDAPQQAPGGAGDAEWFMDHYNADGTTAEMCGNGIRLFARYLVTAGFIGPGELQIATRAGVRTVHVPAQGDVTVDMGAPVAEPPVGLATGTRASVTVEGDRFIGTAVSMGNPHLVCELGTSDEVAALDLSRHVDVEHGDFPEGVNVELFAWTDRAAGAGGTDGAVSTGGTAGLPSAGRVRMRVHERGVGETLSCGTGACAVVVAALGRPGSSLEVDVPGGRLTIAWTDATLLLSGPAVLVADGTWCGEGSSVTAGTPAHAAATVVG